MGKTAKPLTDAELRKLVRDFPADRALQKRGCGNGLVFVIERTSEAHAATRWVFEYRFGGRRKSLGLGTYPAVTLSAARERAGTARALLAASKDPMAERKAEKRAAAVAHLTTFDKVADEWLEKRRPLCSPETHGKLVWLVSLARPALGTLQVGAIAPADVVAALKPVVSSGRLDTARRCRANLSRIFNYAAIHGLCSSDPAAPLARNDEILPPPIVEHHAAVTDRRDGDRDGDAVTRFGGLLRACWRHDGHPTVRNALKLIALIAVRPGELRRLRWSWVTLEGDAPCIKFPAGVMKMRADFEVPLSRQAIEVLTEQREMTGQGELAFPAVAPQRSTIRRPTVRPISETTLNAALRRLGYSHDEHVAHGFRSCFSSLANESRVFDADTIEAALAHAVGGVRGVYLRSAFTPERRMLARWWADRCDALREERAVSNNVVPIVRPA
jgi:integrase